MTTVLLFLLKIRLLVLVFPFLCRIAWSFFEDFIHSILDRNPVFPFLLILATAASTTLFAILILFLLFSLGFSPVTSKFNQLADIFFKDKESAQVKLEMENKKQLELEKSKKIEESLTKFIQNTQNERDYQDILILEELKENQLANGISSKQLYQEYQEFVKTQPLNWKILYNAAVLAAKNNKFDQAEIYLNQAQKIRLQ